MSESMIDRVAQAIYETEPYGTTPTGRAVPWADVAKSQKEGFRVKARAAVSEMREPTDAMVDAALSADGIYEDGSNDYLVYYQSFIDTALNEQVSG